MKTRIKRIFRNFINILHLPEMQVLPGQLAFYILTSFVPILAICTIIVSYFISNFNLTSMIYSYLPDAIADIIIPFITSSSNVSIWFLFICYTFLAINWPKSIIIASNSLYKVNEQKFLAILLKSYLMTFVMIILLTFIIFIPVLGNIIIKLIDNSFDINSYLTVITWLKYLTSFIFIYFSVKLLYSLAPSKPIPASTTTIGSLWTTISWIISTELFAFYITKIAKFNLLYGNFANILILLTWVYLLAYLFVMGMAMNINKYNSLKNN